MKNKKRVSKILWIIISIGILQVILAPSLTPTKYVDLPKGKMSYDLYEQGPQIMIATHGSPGSKKDFKQVGPELTKTTLYAVDMYGFGDSEKYVDEYGIETAADDLNLFMEKLGIEKAQILGYSWGGGVAEVFAQKYPQKTQELILFHAIGIQEGEPTGSYFLEHVRYVLSYPFVTLYPGAFVMKYGQRKGFMRSYMDSDQRIIRSLLKEIKVPTTIIHGTNDNVIPMWVAEEHQSLIPQSKLVTYEGHHGAIFRQGKRVAEVIENR